MGQIYSIVRHTVIYLGHSTPSIDAAFQYAVSSAKDISSEEDERHKSPEELQLQLVARELLDRAWFTRIWAFQGLVLSRDPWVQCGKSRLKWTTFCGTLLCTSVVEESDHSPAVFPSEYIALENYYTEFETLRSLNGIRTAYRIDKVERQGVSELALLDLVTFRRGLGVTDPRDIIFGHMVLVGMPLDGVPFGSNESLLRAPEYGKSVEDVFMDFARDMMEWYGFLEIFSYREALCPSKRMSNLASWAPDWSVHPFKQPQIIKPRGWKWLSGAKAAFQRPHSWIPNSRLLLVSGDSFKVVEVSRVIPWNPSDIIVLGDDESFFVRDFRWFLDNHYH